MILRQSTTETAWDNGRMPADTAVLIFTPYFHRDGERLASAHRFEPGIWLGTDRPVSLVPFSAGPAICPAHNLVPMLAAAAIATLIDGRHLTLERGPALNPQRPLPGTLDNYTLRIRYKH